MKFIQRLFGGSPPPQRAPDPLQAHTQMQSNPPSQQMPLSQNATRRELLRVALRETLHRHGIPAQWIGAESLTTKSRTGEQGIHWRLLVQHWDPRLLTHAVALEKALVKRVTSFDPLATTWLAGVSWQFALADDSECPPMPHPGSWTAAKESASTGDADIIEGPAHVAAPGAQPTAADPDAHADLEKLLAIRDADYRQHADAAAWPRTEPAKLAEDA